MFGQKVAWTNIVTPLVCLPVLIWMGYEYHDYANVFSRISFGWLALFIFIINLVPVGFGAYNLLQTQRKLDERDIYVERKCLQGAYSSLVFSIGTIWVMMRIPMITTPNGKLARLSDMLTAQVTGDFFMACAFISVLVLGIAKILQYRRSC